MDVIRTHNAGLRLTGRTGPALRLFLALGRNDLPRRLYDPCPDGVIVAETVHGVELARTHVETSWYNHLLTFDLGEMGSTCGGEGVLTLPYDFDLTQPVVLAVYDARTEELLAESVPVRLATPAPGGGTLDPADDPIYDGPGNVLDVIGDGFGLGLSGLGRGLETVNTTLRLGLAAAIIGGGAYLAWPLVQELRDRMEDA